MELRPITNAVTKTVVVVMFWVVLLIDLILEPSISFKEIAFALIKAVVISGIFWLLLVMLIDTFLKTILMDAKEKRADRIDGGLSYHVTEPDAEELTWLKMQEKEKAKENESLNMSEQFNADNKEQRK
jgi:signal transduction histidine kinase